MSERGIKLFFIHYKKLTTFALLNNIFWSIDQNIDTTKSLFMTIKLYQVLFSRLLCHNIFMSKKVVSAKKVSKKTNTENIGISESTKKDILAIFLLVNAIIIIFALLNKAGWLGRATADIITFFVGYGIYILPIIYLSLAWMLIRSSKFLVRKINYIGSITAFLAMTGVLYLAKYSPNSGFNYKDLTVSGGIIGFVIGQALTMITTTTVSIIILVVIILISIMLMVDTRIVDMFSLFRSKSKKGDNKSEELKINDSSGDIVSGTTLPVKGILRAESKPKEPSSEDTTQSWPISIDWKFPPSDLLKAVSTKADAGNVKENAAIIQNTLSHFGVDVSMADVNIGPTVTQYSLKPPAGVKLTKIMALDKDLALSLAAHPIRIEAPIPGKSLVGVEIPNKKVASVRMKEILTNPEYKAIINPLNFILGRDVSGEIVSADLARMPHLLVAGATGSGKSVMINTMLASLLLRNSPESLRIILVDPKRVEMVPYNDVPHLLSPVIVDPEKTISALKWAVVEMDRRYRILASLGKRNIGEYNTLRTTDDTLENLPYIVFVIDELADLMAVASSDVEGLIVRLAQMARAIGIHLVLATQRPSVDVITGIIKANFPARIALATTSQVDSRTIIDQAGAEKLLGKGDMLFVSPEYLKPKRVQGVYLDETEVETITGYMRSQMDPQYNEEVLNQTVKIGGATRGYSMDAPEEDDELFEEAANMVIESQKASASYLQRRFRIGYARAARLLDILEIKGVVGPADGAKPREVLVGSLSELGQYSSQEEDFD